MQIKLIPATPLPTVLFTVTYSEPPDYLGFPASWAQALHRLSADDLELPGTVHAFDKTTWLVAVLHSVTFDLGRGIVVCAYVDGRTEGWALEEEDGEMRLVEAGEEGEVEVEVGGRKERRRRCREELESVLRDVNRSAVEADREKRRAEAAQQQAQAAAAAMAAGAQIATDAPASSSSVSSTGKHGKDKEGKEGRDGKHKKQRSLLMSLVACVHVLRRCRRRLRRGGRGSQGDVANAPRSRSLVSPNKHGHGSAASAVHHAQPANPAVAPAPVAVASTATADDASSVAASSVLVDDDEEHMSSTALRRRARSTLVNAFRRHVLSRLSARAQPGGYAAWIARSMLGRVESEMAQMVRDAGGVPDMDPTMGWAGVGAGMGMGGMGMVRGGKAPSATGATRGTESVVASDGAPGAGLADDPPPFFEDVDVDGERNSDGDADEDADGDRDSASTDTDGSSVHTPDTVSFDGSPFFSPPRCSSPPPSPPSSPTPPALAPGSASAAKHRSHPIPISPSKPKLRRQTIFAPRSPSVSPSSTSHLHAHSPGRPNFSPCDLAAYTALSGQRLRLQSVLTRIEAQLAMQAQDERQLQSVLEIKSRRRAWSNKQFMGSANVRFMGLCTPARSSPLARYEPISASDSQEPTTVVVPGQRGTAMGAVMEGMGMGGKPKRGLVVTTAEHNIMRLFPVCEEDEEEEPAPPYQSAIAVPHPAPPSDGDDPPDLNEKDIPLAMPTVRLVEERSLPDADVVLPLPLQLQRHAVPIRPRTRGIVKTENGNTTTTYTHAGDNEKLGLSVLEPQTKVELFDVYHSEDEDEDEPGLGDVTIGLEGCGGKHSEFTIGMDIPESFGMGIEARRFDHEEWISVANASIPSR